MQNNAKIQKNHWNPGSWVLIWEYSMRAIQRVPTRQGLDGFQKSLHFCALDESRLSIGRVKMAHNSEREREIPATPSVAQYSHMIKTAGLHNAHSNWFSLSTPQPEPAPRFVREITFSWLNGLWWSLSLVNRHFFFIECSNSEVGNKTFIKALRVKSILTLNELYKVVLL